MHGTSAASTGEQPLLQRLRLPYRIDRLPALARRYRDGFRSGSGNERSTVARLFHRLAYYGLAAASWSPAWGELQLDVRGTQRRIRFDVRNRQFNALYFRKFRWYEPEVAALVTELLPRDGVFHDIGANWGYFSLLVATDATFQGQVHAFEPWPASFRDLRTMTEQAGLAPWLRTHPFAIGETTAKVGMRCGRHSGLARVDDHMRRVRVQQCSLDDLEIPAPDLLKIDAEGAELAVLKGGRRLFRERRPKIVMEHSTSRAESGGSLESLRFLETVGYQWFVPMLEYRQPRQDPDDGERNTDTVIGYGADKVPDGFVPLRLHLIGIASDQRSAFDPYLNLFACPRESVGDLARDSIAIRTSRPLLAVEPR